MCQNKKPESLHFEWVGRDETQLWKHCFLSQLMPPVPGIPASIRPITNMGLILFLFLDLFIFKETRKSA